jgi:hypothetical protein
MALSYVLATQSAVSHETMMKILFTFYEMTQHRRRKQTISIPVMLVRDGDDGPDDATM